LFLLLVSSLLLKQQQRKKKKKQQKKNAGETPTGRKGKMPSPRAGGPDIDCRAAAALDCAYLGEP
jgi:hypothetical protein